MPLPSGFALEGTGPPDRRLPPGFVVDDDPEQADGRAIPPGFQLEAPLAAAPVAAPPTARSFGTSAPVPVAAPQDQGEVTIGGMRLGPKSVVSPLDRTIPTEEAAMNPPLTVEPAPVLPAAPPAPTLPAARLGPQPAQPTSLGAVDIPPTSVPPALPAAPVGPPSLAAAIPIPAGPYKDIIEDITRRGTASSKVLAVEGGQLGGARSRMGRPNELLFSGFAAAGMTPNEIELMNRAGDEARGLPGRKLSQPLYTPEEQAALPAIREKARQALSADLAKGSAWDAFFVGIPEGAYGVRMAGPELDEKHPVSAWVGRLGGGLATLGLASGAMRSWGLARRIMLRIAGRNPTILRLVTGKIAGEIVHSAATFAGVGAAHEVIGAAREGKVDTAESLKNIGIDALQGAGWGLAGRIPNTALRLTTEATYGALAVKAQGGSDEEALGQAALVVLFGTMARKGLRRDLRSAAYNQIRWDLADQLVARGMTGAQARLAAEVILSRAAENSTGKQGREAVETLLDDPKMGIRQYQRMQNAIRQYADRAPQWVAGQQAALPAGTVTEGTPPPLPLQSTRGPTVETQQPKPLSPAEAPTGATGERLVTAPPPFQPPAIPAEAEVAARPGGETVTPPPGPTPARAASKPPELMTPEGMTVADVFAIEESGGKWFINRQSTPATVRNKGRPFPTREAAASRAQEMLPDEIKQWRLDAAQREREAARAALPRNADVDDIAERNFPVDSDPFDGTGDRRTVPGDTLGRVVWDVKRGQDIVPNTLDRIGVEGENPNVRGLHVGDTDYWRKRLNKDFDRRGGRAINIRMAEGDRLVTDRQYVTDPDTGEKADSAVLLTARKVLKYGRDWVFDGEVFKGTPESTVANPPEYTEHVNNLQVAITQSDFDPAAWVARYGDKRTPRDAAAYLLERKDVMDRMSPQLRKRVRDVARMAEKDISPLPAPAPKAAALRKPAKQRRMPQERPAAETGTTTLPTGAVATPATGRAAQQAEYGQDAASDLAALRSLRSSLMSTSDNAALDKIKADAAALKAAWPKWKGSEWSDAFPPWLEQKTLAEGDTPAGIVAVTKSGQVKAKKRNGKWYFAEGRHEGKLVVAPPAIRQLEAAFDQYKAKEAEREAPAPAEPPAPVTRAPESAKGVVVETDLAGDKTVSVPSKDREGLPPKQQKAYLLAEIEKAVALSPDALPEANRPAYDAMTLSSNELAAYYERPYADFLGEKGTRLAEASRKANEAFKATNPPTVTIEVPGDGTFEIWDFKAALKDFAEKAKKFPVSVPKADTAKPASTEPPAIAAIGNRPPPPLIGKWAALLKPFASTDETRPVLAEPHVDGKAHVMVATDGRRMAVAMGVRGPTTKHMVPGTRYDKDTKKTVPTGKMEAADFPNWQQIIPGGREGKLPDISDRENVVVTDTEKLTRQLRQALQVGPVDRKSGKQESSDLVDLFLMPDGSLAVAAQTPEVGEYRSADIEQGRYLASMNPDMMLDTLNFMRRTGNESVTFSFAKPDGTLAPMVAVGAKEYVVQMPMRISDERRTGQAQISAQEQAGKKYGFKAAQPVETKKPTKPMRMDGTTRPERKPAAPAAPIPAKSVAMMNDAIAAKDVETLTTKGMLDPRNKAWRSQFEATTGVKLPSTINGMREAVEKWASAQEPQPVSEPPAATALKEAAAAPSKGAFEVGERVLLGTDNGQITGIEPDDYYKVMWFGSRQETTVAGKHLRRRTVSPDRVNLDEAPAAAAPSAGDAIRGGRKKKLYRGVMNNGEGAGTFSMGKGLYSSPNRQWLTESFKFDRVIELTTDEAYPTKPLVLRDPAEFMDWALRESGESNARRFNEKYPDPGEFVKSKGYNGVVAGDEIVKYSEPSPPQPASEKTAPGIEAGEELKTRSTDKGVAMFARTDAPPPFYSALSRAVESLPADFKAPGDQFLKRLEGLRNKGQAWKAQEAEESGFADWVKMQTENGVAVTKADAVAFLAQNGVRMEVVEKWERSESTEDIARRIYGKEWIDLTDDQRQEANRQSKASAETDTKFSQYAPPGGVPGTYREVLMTVLSKHTANFSARPYGSGWAIFSGDERLSGAINEKSAKTRAEELNATGPEKGSLLDLDGKYTSPHWSEPNVIAHMLMDERRIPLDVLEKTHPELAAKLRAEGKTEARALHMIEGQSDWHQQGVAKGYWEDFEKRFEVIPQDVKWAQVLPERMWGGIQHRTGFVSFDKSEVEQVIRERGYGELRELVEGDPERVAVYVAIDHETGLPAPGDYSVSDTPVAARKVLREVFRDIPPSAPFRGDAWKRLVLRKMIQQAASGGYDLLTWSTGADRAAKWGSERVEWKKKNPTEVYTDKQGQYRVMVKDSGYIGPYTTREEAQRKAKQYDELHPVEGWTVAGTEQSGGEHAGQNIEALARERGILLEQKGQTVRTKDDLRRIVTGILRNPEAGKVDKLTDRIWTRMQTEPEGTSMPRREFFEFLYDKSFVNEANDIVRRMDKGARVQDAAVSSLERTKEGRYIVKYDTATGWEVWDKERDKRVRKAKSREEATAIRKGLELTSADMPVHAIPLTDAIRAAVEQGQPYYARTDAAAAPTPEQARRLNAEYLAAVESGDEAAQRMVDEAAKGAGRTLLYRAGRSSEHGVKKWSSWATERETAERYTEEGVGHGGDTIRSEYVKIENELDLTSGKDGIDIARAIGLTGDEAADYADKVNDIGVRYPWEERSSIKRDIEAAGFDAIRYLDDYPEGATTVVPLTTDSVSADPITRDDQGNVIPLYAVDGKPGRFDPTSNDIRYAQGGQNEQQGPYPQDAATQAARQDATRSATGAIGTAGPRHHVALAQRAIQRATEALDRGRYGADVQELRDFLKSPHRPADYLKHRAFTKRMARNGWTVAYVSSAPGIEGVTLDDDRLVVINSARSIPHEESHAKLVDGDPEEVAMFNRIDQAGEVVQAYDAALRAQGIVQSAALTAADVLGDIRAGVNRFGVEVQAALRPEGEAVAAGTGETGRGPSARGPPTDAMGGGQAQFSIAGRNAVTPEQARRLNAEYLAAVEAGDEAAQDRMVAEAAKKAGYNVGPVWHGTAGKFTVFRNRYDIEDENLGIWFTVSRKSARGYSQIASNKSAQLDGSIEKPRVIRAFLRNAEEIEDPTSGHEEYLVHDPSQIKSADRVTRDKQGRVILLYAVDGKPGRFDPLTPDIGYGSIQPGGEHADIQREIAGDGVVEATRKSLARQYRDQLAGRSAALRLSDRIRRKRTFDSWLRSLPQKSRMDRENWSGVSFSSDLNDSDDFGLLAQHADTIGFEAVPIEGMRPGGMVDHTGKTIFLNRQADSSDLIGYSLHEFTHALRGEPAVQNLIANIDQQHPLFKEWSAYLGYGGDNAAEELAAAIVSGRTDLEDMVKEKASIAEAQAAVISGRPLTNDIRYGSIQTGDHNADQIIEAFARAGRGHTIPPSARAGWENALERARQRAGGQPVHARRLAGVRTSEAFGASEVYRGIQAVADGLEIDSVPTGVIERQANTLGSSYGSLPPPLPAGLSPAERTAAGFMAVGRKIGTAEGEEKGRLALPGLVAEALDDVKGKVWENIQKRLPHATLPEGDKRPAGIVGAVSVAVERAKTQGARAAEQGARALDDAIASGLEAVRRRMAKSLGGKVAYIKVVESLQDAIADIDAARATMTPEALEQSVNERLTKLFGESHRLALRRATHHNAAQTFDRIRAYVDAERRAYYIDRLHFMYGGKIVRTIGPDGTIVERKSKGIDPRDLVNTPGYEYADQWREMQNIIKPAELTGMTTEQLQDAVERSRVILAGSAHAQQQIAEVHDLRRADLLTQFRGTVSTATDPYEGIELHGTPRRGETTDRFASRNHTLAGLAGLLTQGDRDTPIYRFFVQTARRADDRKAALVEAALRRKHDKLKELGISSMDWLEWNSTPIPIRLPLAPGSTTTRTIHMTKLQIAVLDGIMQDTHGAAEKAMQNGVHREGDEGKPELLVKGRDNIQAILDQGRALDPRIHRLAEFYVEEMTDIGTDFNQTSMAVNGTQLADGTPFFSLAGLVERQGETPEVQDFAQWQEQQVERIGVARRRVAHRNPVVLQNADTHFNRWLDDAATYVHWSIPFKDIMTILRDREAQAITADRHGPELLRSIREQIDGATGRLPAKPRGVWSSIFGRMASQALAWNQRVALLNRLSGSWSLFHWLARERGLATALKFAVRSLRLHLPFVLTGQQARMRDLLLNNPHTGYFQTRWVHNPYEVVSNQPMSRSLDVARSRWQMFRRWVSLKSVVNQIQAEERNAAETLTTLLAAGVPEREAILETADSTRDLQNPSSELEMTTRYRASRGSGEQLFFGFTGQSSVISSYARRTAREARHLWTHGDKKRALALMAGLLAFIAGYLLIDEATRRLQSLARKGLLRRKPTEKEEKQMDMAGAVNVLSGMGDFAGGGFAGRLINQTAGALLYDQPIDSGMIGDMLSAPLRIGEKWAKSAFRGEAMPDDAKADSLWVAADFLTKLVGAPVGGVKNAVQIAAGLAGEPIGYTPPREAKGPDTIAQYLDELPPRPSQAYLERTARQAFNVADVAGEIETEDDQGRPIPRSVQKARFRRRFMARARNRQADEQGE